MNVFHYDIFKISNRVLVIYQEIKKMYLIFKVYIIYIIYCLQIFKDLCMQKEKGL